MLLFGESSLLLPVRDRLRRRGLPHLRDDARLLGVRVDAERARDEAASSVRAGDRMTHLLRIACERKSMNLLAGRAT